MKTNNVALDGPILDKIKVHFADAVDFTQHPFSLPIIKSLECITFPSQVTFFVGENGAGKSTILEAIAHHSGFGAEGGSKNIHFKTSEEKTYTGTQSLADQFTLSFSLSLAIALAQGDFSYLMNQKLPYHHNGNYRSSL